MKKSYLQSFWELIPQGADNALKRSELANRLQCDDRQARLLIENMIYKDLPVCNLRHGYFRPVTKDEVKQYKSIIRSYKNKLEKKLYRLSKAEKRLGG